MRTLRLLTCLLLLSGAATAQKGWKFSATGRYLMANEWDEIVRTYNFARPWIEEPMPLFSYGWNAEVGYTMLLGRGVTVTPGLGFLSNTARAYSSAAATGGDEYKLRASIHALTVNSNFCLHPLAFGATSGFRSRLFTELNPSFALLMPRVREAGNLVEADEDEIYRPFSPAFRLSLGLGYTFKLNDRLLLAPVVRGEWWPTAELPDFAAMVNGSYFPDLADESPVFAVQFGLTMHLLPKRINHTN